jgi:hypothetical protein
MMFNGGLIKRSATLLYHLIQFRCQVGSYFSFSNSRELFPHRWSEGVAAVPSSSLCQPSITWSDLIEKHQATARIGSCRGCSSDDRDESA